MAKKSYEIEATFEGKDRLSPTMKKVSGGMGRLVTQGAALAAGFVGVQVAIKGLQVGMRLLNNTIREAVKLASYQEEMEIKLATALQQSGHYTKEAFERQKEYAASLQKTTRYSDEMILEVQALLANVGKLSGEGLERATQATLDLATVWKMDLQSAAAQVAKAAGGFMGGLTRYGVILNDAIPESQRFADALGQIEDKMGKAAQAQAMTMAGIIDRIKYAYGDVLEVVGDIGIKSKSLRAVLIALTQTMIRAGDAVKEFGEKSQETIDETVLNIVMSVLDKMQNWAIRYSASVDKIGEKSKDATKHVGDFGRGLKTIGEGIEAVGDIPQAIWTGYQINIAKLIGANDEAARMAEKMIADLKGMEGGLDAVTGAAPRAEGALMGVAKEIQVFKDNIRKALAALKDAADETKNNVTPAFGAVGAELEANILGARHQLAGITADLQERVVPAAQTTWEMMMEIGEFFTQETYAIFEEITGALENRFMQATDRLVDAMWNSKVRFKDIWQDMLKDFVKGFLRKMVAAFINAVNEMIAKWLAFKALTNLFGGFFFSGGGAVGGSELGDWNLGPMDVAALGGPVKRYARGHQVGLGTDTVPALLVPGEHVVNRPAAQAFRPVLDAMNQWGRSRYAMGGNVQAASPTINLHISAIDAESVANFFRFGGGQRAVQSAFDGGYFNIPSHSMV